MLYRWLVCSYISDLSNNQLPQLCCQMDSKAPNAHLVCVLNSRLGEGSWKAVEEKHSVLDPSGVVLGQRVCLPSCVMAGRENKHRAELHGEQREGWGIQYWRVSWCCFSHSCVRHASCATCSRMSGPSACWVACASHSAAAALSWELVGVCKHSAQQLCSSWLS